MDVITYQVSDFDGELYGLIYQTLARTCDSIVKRDQDDNPHNSQQVSEIVMKLYQCNSVAEAIMRSSPNITQAFDEISGGPIEFQASVDFLRSHLLSHDRTTLTDGEYYLAWTLFHHLDHDWIMNGPLSRPPDLRWSSAELQTIIEQCVNRYFEHADDETGADPVFNFLSEVASSTETHLTTIFKTYLDQIARGSDPVQALADAPFWQEGGTFREVATRDPVVSTSVAQHGFDHFSLQEQLDIIAEAYEVPTDEYRRWSTIIYDVERLKGYVQPAHEGDGGEAGHVASVYDNIASTMLEGTGDLAYNHAAYELFTDLGDTMYRCGLLAQAIMKNDNGTDADVTEEAVQACIDAAASVAAAEGESPPDFGTLTWDIWLKYTADRAKQLTQNPIATLYLQEGVCDLIETLMGHLENKAARYWTPEEMTDLLQSTRALSTEAQDENVRRLANSLYQYLSGAAETAVLRTLQLRDDEPADDSFARWAQLLITEPEDMPIAPENLNLASKMGILGDQGILWQLEAAIVNRLVDLVEQLRDSDDEEVESASDA